MLGYLPEYLLGGAFRLDLKAAERACQSIADELGIDLYAAAEGILKIANETMYGALRLVSIEQGFDPRDFSLVAFGGAGPLHACALGKLLLAFPVIIPPSPGVLCAWGDATTILRHEVSITYIRILADITGDELTATYDALLSKAATVMINEQGVPKEKHIYKYQADLRYLGQAISLPIDVDATELKQNALGHISELFQAAHEKSFTFRLASKIELVNLRIVVLEETPEFVIKKVQTSSTNEPPESAISGKTKLVCEGHEYNDSPIWERSQLKSGHIVKGPCLVTEMDSNTVILPGFKAEVDHVGNILIWEDKPATNGNAAAVNGLTTGMTNGYINKTTKDEPLDMVTGKTPRFRTMCCKFTNCNSGHL